MIPRLLLTTIFVISSSIAAQAEIVSVFCAMSSQDSSSPEILTVYSFSGTGNQYTALGTDTNVTVVVNDDELVIGDVSQKTLLTFSLAESSSIFEVEGLYQGEIVSGVCNNISELIEETEKETRIARTNDLLSQERALSTESQRQVVLLNQQTAALRKQLGALQGLLDASAKADREARVQLQTLSSDLNAALARVAAEQKARAGLQTAYIELQTINTAPRVAALSEEHRRAIVDAVSRNWNKSIIIGKENYERLVITIIVNVSKSGTIVGVEPVEPINPVGDFLVAYNAARRSVLRAELIPLPEDTFSGNLQLVLTFDPTSNTASLR